MHSITKHSSILSIILMVIFCCLISCEKFLDKNPDKSVAVPTTLSDLQALLDYTARMNIKTTPNFGESSSDDYFLPDETYNSFDYLWQNIYTWQRRKYYFQNDWSTAYIPVYNANYCLDQIQKISQTNADRSTWNNVYGSSLFFRSYNFLNLLWVYAKAYDKNTSDKDLGIVLRLTSDFNVKSERATVEECYNKVVEDAKNSVNYLPNLPANVMRPSKASAYGLLARAYLSMGNYDSAYKYSNLSLELKSDLIDLNGDPDMNGDVTAAVPFKAYNKETIFYTEMITTDPISASFFAKVDTLLYNQFEQDDLRKAAYFAEDNGYQVFKGNYTGLSSRSFTGIATDELYLMRAECLVRAGKTTEGMADLNTLLIKRWNNTTPFIPLTAANTEQALQIVLRERRKELYMRGLRWMDIKRLNKEGANITLRRVIEGQTYTLQPNANYYALPLPTDIIQQTGMQQNPE